MGATSGGSLPARLRNQPRYYTSDPRAEQAGAATAAGGTGGGGGGDADVGVDVTQQRVDRAAADAVHARLPRPLAMDFTRNVASTVGASHTTAIAAAQAQAGQPDRSRFRKQLMVRGVRGRARAKAARTAGVNWSTVAFSPLTRSRAPRRSP